MKFCKCGLPLDRKINKRYDMNYPDHCNKHCFERYERLKSPKNRKKYGIAGTAYDFYHKDDVLKKWGK